jgi:hypothetical protein
MAFIYFQFVNENETELKIDGSSLKLVPRIDHLYTM